MIRIRIEEAGHPPRTTRLESLPAEVGRADNNTIVLDRGHVSSRHGELFLLDGAAAYADLGSTNGTALVRNDTAQKLGAGRRSAVRLEPGDRLVIGSAKESLSLFVEALDAADTIAGPVPTVAASRASSIMPAELIHRVESPQTLAALCRFARVTTEVQNEDQLAAHLASACSSLFGLATHVVVTLRPESNSTPATLNMNGDANLPQPRVMVFARGVDIPEPGPPPSKLTAKVREDGHALLVNDPENTGGVAVRSVMLASLCDSDQDWDVVAVQNRDHAQPFSESDLDLLVLLASQTTLTLGRLRRESSVGAQVEWPTDGQKSLYIGPGFQSVLRTLDSVIDSDVSVLITGETGTGKEVVSRYIHEHGPRNTETLVAVNCAAFVDSLLDSELFGHERGAFTGATSARRGLFEVADGSTLFLDEIGDLTPAMQTKLLRVLETGEVRRVGTETPRQVDVRVVAATNKDLREEVAEGRFRSDLFYRLAVFLVEIPPLRERREDIVPLATYFLQQSGAKRGSPDVRLSEAAGQLLKAQDWRGNARELRNEMERADLRRGGATIVDPLHLSRTKAKTEEAPVDASMSLPIAGNTFASLERLIYEEVLRLHGGHQGMAAKALGLKYTTFRFRAKRVGVL